MIIPGLYIQKTEQKGRGVFTNISIPEDTVIEISPVVVMSAKERLLLDETRLHDYIFEWQPGGAEMCCMAMGYVPVYNHSGASNCEYFMDYDAEEIYIKTVRSIAAGEELTINYNGDWDNPAPVWFDAAPAT